MSVALGGASACSSGTTTTAVLPITGVTVRAEAVTRGRGCGPGATEIFKYVVVAFGRNPNNTASYDQFLAGNVYDCFLDAQFAQLPASGGTTDYQLRIYAYNQAAFLAAGDARVRAAAGNPADLPATNPTLSTTCVAQQIQDVQTLAVCQPLAAGASGASGAGTAGTTVPAASVVLSAASFPSADGGVLTCDGQYTTIRYRSGIGTALGAVTESRCNRLTDKGLEPLTITISPAVAPASYVIEVALLRADGTLLGQTTCGADTSPGLTSSAVCKPVQ